jgi:hypothetical protein
MLCEINLIIRLICIKILVYLVYVTLTNMRKVTFFLHLSLFFKSLRKKKKMSIFLRIIQKRQRMIHFFRDYYEI